MQVHEITEGFFSNVARGFAQGVSGVDFSAPITPGTPPVQKPQVPQQATATQAPPVTGKPAPETRIVVSLSQPGQDLPSKYYKTGTRWTNELGQPIQNPKQTAYLEKLIPTHGVKEVVPVQPAEPARTARRRPRYKS